MPTTEHTSFRLAIEHVDRMTLCLKMSFITKVIYAYSDKQTVFCVNPNKDKKNIQDNHMH